METCRWPRKPVLAVAAPHLSKKKQFFVQNVCFFFSKTTKKGNKSKKIYILNIAAGHQKIEKMKLLIS